MKLSIEHTKYSCYASSNGAEYDASISLRLSNLRSSHDYLEVLRYVQNFVDEFDKAHVVVEPPAPTLSELGLLYDEETGTVGPKPSENVGPVFLDKRVGLAELVVNKELSTPTGPFVKPSVPAEPKEIVTERAPEPVATPVVEEPATPPVDEPKEEIPEPEPPSESELLAEEFRIKCYEVKNLEQAVEVWSNFFSRMSKYGKPYTDERGVDLTMALADALNVEAQEAKAMIREGLKKAAPKPTPGEEAAQPKPATPDLTEVVDALAAKFEELESDPKLSESEVFRVSILACKSADPQKVYPALRDALDKHVKSRNGSLIKGFFPADTILQDRILNPEKNAKFRMMARATKLPA